MIEKIKSIDDFDKTIIGIDSNSIILEYNLCIEIDEKIEIR